VPPLENKVRACPVHIALLLDAVAAGIAFTVTIVCAVAEHPLALVTVTIYVPAPDEVTPGIDGTITSASAGN
jgi:hypothetical protein